MMIQTKKMTLLQVLGSLSLVLLLLLLLLLVGIGGAQPLPADPMPPAGPVSSITDRVLIGSTDTNRVFRYDGSTTPSSIDAFVIPQNLGLAGPRGLVFGPDGNLYVNSRDTDEVLRYDGTTGALIGTFVLKGSGGLSGPTSLKFGSDGNLYVSSGNANEVLRYNGGTGAFIDVFVGDDPATPTINEAGSLQMPRGIEFGPDGNLYVSSRDSDEILRYDGTMGTFLGAFVTDFPQTPFDESGGLLHPTGLTFGTDNNLYVNSFDTNQVLQYNAAGAFIRAFVTNDPATPNVDESGGLFQPVGIMFGPGPTLYVSSFSNNAVLSYDATGTFLGPFVSDNPATVGVDETGGLQLAAELLFDAAGNLLVSSFGGNQVLLYNGMTGAFQSVFAPLNPVAVDEPDMPTGMAIGPNGDLYVTSTGTNRILRYDGATGAFLGIFVADDPATLMVDESGGLVTPAALAFDAAGNLYVSSFQNNRVLRYDTAGLFMENFVFDDPATPAVDESGGLVGPIGIAFDSGGNVYVSSRITGNVLRYDATGTFMGGLVANGTLAAPAELAFASGGGNLYVSESGANAIRRFDGTGALIDTIVADDPATVGIDESGGLLTPRGLGVSTDGSSLLVNSSGSDQVLRYDSATGVFLEVFLSNDILPEAVGRLDRPVGLLLTPPTALPTEPAPTEPAPTEPAPTEPAPTEPAPTPTP